MRARALAISNDPIAEEAAIAQLGQGGSAVGAVLAGFFAAAGGYSGVLLSPLTILIAGIGTGGRAFDGRLRQPGLGTKRPRGFLPDESIPSAARIAVPGSVAAAAVANAYDGAKSLGSLVKHGILRAERAGADGRAEVLGRVRSLGQVAFSEQSFSRPFLRLAGPSEGGLVTPSDLTNITDIDHAANIRNIAGSDFLEPPWSDGTAGEPLPPELGIGAAVCAVDVRGVFAAAAYFRPSDGVEIEDLALLAPYVAIPTQRGVPRQAPGSPLPAPAPIAVRCNEAGVPIEVCAEPGARGLDFGKPSRLSITRDPVSREVTAQRR
jgi:gamma-glutamyltranspeptidase/glutathione hydrolase